MIVLNRKKLLLITSCVFVGIFTFLITTTNLQETVQTVSLPVSGKVIVVDAGHGVPDERGKMLKLRNETLQITIYQRNI